MVIIVKVIKRDINRVEKELVEFESDSKVSNINIMVEIQFTKIFLE